MKHIKIGKKEYTVIETKKLKILLLLLHDYTYFDTLDYMYLLNDIDEVKLGRSTGRIIVNKLDIWKDNCGKASKLIEDFLKEL